MKADTAWPFVTRSTTGTLQVNGIDTRFSGANIYWLGLAEDGGTHYPSHFRIDDGIATAQEMGATVVRSISLGDSVGCALCLEPRLHQFNDQAFESIDYAIKSAHDHGIRLVIPLIDNWTYYDGGRHTFGQWEGLENVTSKTGDPNAFFDNQTVINDFKEYINHILTHVNQYTGIALKDDSTILAWETGNELFPGWPDANWQRAYYPDWTKQIADYIKTTIGAQQLIGDGHDDVDDLCPQTTPEGVTEQYCSLDLPNVDIYSNHFYQLIAANNTESKLQQDSNNVKNNKHKVYYVGEYDWTGNGDTISLSQWLSDIENDSVSLDTYWSLFPHNDTHGFVWHCDGFTLHYTGDNQTAISNNCPGSYSFSDMRTRTQQLRTHAYKMSNLLVPPAKIPAAPLLYSPIQGTKGILVDWQGVVAGDSYTIERSMDNGATWQVVAQSVSDNNAPWVDNNGTMSALYRIKAINIDGVSGPYSGGMMPTPTLASTSTPIPTATPTLTPTPIVMNLLQNPSFENTGTNWLNPWTFQIRSGANGSISHASNTKVNGMYSADVSITKSNTTDWYIQLMQGNLALTSGRTYTLSFWAKASKSRKIRIAVQQDYSPYMIYAQQTFTLTSSWQQYTMTFTQFQTDNTLLAFNLAQATGNVWLDSISLN